ncbi:MAG: chemotaxis protein CheB [Bacteroidetes bacterium]|nr:MAG: chemotaxis protein CheB [Bacteroidota bacterium]
MPDKNLETKEKSENGVNSASQWIIVIGASAGGFEAFKTLVKKLPSDFSTPILIVWHLSPDVQGVLPQVLNRVNKIFAANAYDGEEIEAHRIYVAPPNRHLLVNDGKMSVTNGPKENGFRPAIDPLFRSAAYAYGNRVIGVILSGALDDGTAGLWTVKEYNGIAIVQDPMDAEVPSMPENARRGVNVDYCVGISELSGLLVQLTKQPLPEMTNGKKDQQTKNEIQIAAGGDALQNGIYDSGTLTPFTCPECNGVLAKLQNGNIVRYRCHTGHAYSIDALLAALTERIEDGLYNAIRGIDESIILLNHLGDHYAEANQPKLAALYFRKAKDAGDRVILVRDAVLKHEQLNKDALENTINGSEAKKTN